MHANTISEQLFFTTVRIDTINQDNQQFSGTGFIFSYEKNDNDYRFIVTNKHVVAEMQCGALTFFTSENQGETPKLGDSFRLEIGNSDWNSMWYGHALHDVDIAICALFPLEQYVNTQYQKCLFYRYVSNHIIPTLEQFEELDALEAVTFIGYPNGLWDTKNYLPIARRGMTASPITVDFEGTSRFLIDASVFGGSSGSPVFIFDKGMYTTKNGGTTVGSRIFFVGVVAAVFYKTENNEIVPVNIPTQIKSIVKQQEMLDIGIVFKARTVIETIEAFIAQPPII